MAGIKVQKKYVSSNLSSSALANNWMVLVFGVTSEGPTEATLIQNYEIFLETFGQPVNGVKTHNYVQFLLNSGVNVLFKRIIDTSKQIKAQYAIEELGLTITATDAYIGEIGNEISFAFKKDNLTNVYSFVIKYKEQEVETHNLGVITSTETLGSLFYKFVSSAANNATFNSKYVTFKLTKNVPDLWSTAFVDEWTAELTGGGTGNVADLDYALAILADDIYKNPFWMDKKLKQAITYYPNLRFVTTGGIIAEEKDKDNKYAKQEKILENLGQFAMNANMSFRVLVDYPFDMENVEEVVRNFATTISSKGKINTAVYAYFGDWGSDDTGTWLPGSAGFLSALGLSSYNVYNRRIAGKNFTPAYTNINNEMYIDSLDNWQAESVIQLNPIVVVDAQNNLAVMGSSTLAMPQTNNMKNPAQALDVVLVGDYVTAILNNIALESLEVALDRLSLASLTNTMNTALDQFVTSGAITRYDLDLDTTILGKLTINCTLYFAVGLDEVELIVSSVYDTEAMQLTTNLE